MGCTLCDSDLSISRTHLGSSGFNQPAALWQPIPGYAKNLKSQHRSITVSIPKSLAAVRLLGLNKRHPPSQLDGPAAVCIPGVFWRWLCRAFFGHVTYHIAFWRSTITCSSHSLPITKGAQLGGPSGVELNMASTPPDHVISPAPTLPLLNETGSDTETLAVPLHPSLQENCLC